MQGPGPRRGSADWPPVAPPYEFELGGEDFRIRDCPPIDLLGVIADGNWLAVVPGLLDDESLLRLWTWWEDDGDALDWDDVFPVATKLMTRFAGCDWWGAQRILDAVRKHWFEFDAHCATKGFDPYTAPLYRTTAVAYAWLAEQQVDYGDPKKTTANFARLEQTLWTPPPWLAAGAEPVAPWTPEEESAGFFAAMGEQL